MAEQWSQPAGRSLDLGHDLGHCARLTPLAAGMLRPQRTGPSLCFSLQQVPFLK